MSFPTSAVAASPAAAPAPANVAASTRSDVKGLTPVARQSVSSPAPAAAGARPAAIGPLPFAPPGRSTTHVGFATVPATAATSVPTAAASASAAAGLPPLGTVRPGSTTPASAPSTHTGRVTPVYSILRRQLPPPTRTTTTASSSLDLADFKKGLLGALQTPTSTTSTAAATPSVSLPKPQSLAPLLAPTCRGSQTPRSQQPVPVGSQLPVPPNKPWHRVPASAAASAASAAAHLSDDDDDSDAEPSRAASDADASADEFDDPDLAELHEHIESSRDDFVVLAGHIDARFDDLFAALGLRATVGALRPVDSAVAVAPGASLAAASTLSGSM